MFRFWDFNKSGCPRAALRKTTFFTAEQKEVGHKQTRFANATEKVLVVFLHIKANF